MTEVAAIILAAGFSRRMGKQNKLLLPVGDIPMIRHMVLTYQCATKASVLVVTGHEQAAVEAAIAGTGARTAFNSSFAMGQQTSVSCGLDSTPDVSLILIGLGDQPLLSCVELQNLLAIHEKADPERISIPFNGKVRGNPILVPGKFRKRLLEDQKTPGCRTFTRNYPEYVQFHKLNCPGFYADVDTPDAYATLKSTLSEEKH